MESYLSDQTLRPCQKDKLSRSHFLSSCPCFDRSDSSHTLSDPDDPSVRGNTDDKRNKHRGFLARPLMTSLPIRGGKAFSFQIIDAERVLAQEVTDIVIY